MHLYIKKKKNEKKKFFAQERGGPLNSSLRFVRNWFSRSNMFKTVEDDDDVVVIDMYCWKNSLNRAYMYLGG